RDPGCADEPCQAVRGSSAAATAKAVTFRPIGRLNRLIGPSLVEPAGPWVSRGFPAAVLVPLAVTRQARNPPGARWRVRPEAGHGMGGGWLRLPRPCHQGPCHPGGW